MSIIDYDIDNSWPYDDNDDVFGFGFHTEEPLTRDELLDVEWISLQEIEEYDG